MSDSTPTPTLDSAEMRMDAYYYEFEKTGNVAIDKILSAVACAGKAFHHTDGWNDEDAFPPPPHTGKTPVEWIQNAANEAATLGKDEGRREALDSAEKVKLLMKLYEDRLTYLARDYNPTPECIEAEFKCDFRADDAGECPCQWALKLNPNCIDKLTRLKGRA